MKIVLYGAGGGWVIGKGGKTFILTLYRLLILAASLDRLDPGI